MAPTNTMVKEYEDTREFNRDAQKLSGQGWQVVSQTERTQRPGCLRILLTGGLAVVRPPKPHIVVTYTRTTNQRS